MTHPTIQQTMLTMMALHDGQVDKSGVPYFNHPIRVMLRLGLEQESPMHHAALLHDVIEDTAATPELLRELGYSEEVVVMVELLSKPKSMTYRDYIRRLMVSGNAGAMRIKLADLYDNSSPSRVEALAAIDQAKATSLKAMISDRYKPAIFQLKMVIGPDAKSVVSEDMDVEVSVEQVKEDLNG